MKFILTSELGRLAKWLRILGFDTSYYKNKNFSSLIIEALRDERAIVTRNHTLPQARGLKIILLKEEKIRKQIEELLNKLQIEYDSGMMFTRCTVCNLQLDKINKEEVKGKVPEYVFETSKVFFSCLKCKRIYWQGTHWGNVKSIIEEIKR